MPTELKFTLLVEEGLLHILSLKCLSVLTLAVLSSNSYFTLEMFPDPWCQGGIFSFCHYFLMLTQFLALKRPGALAALSQSGWWPQECHSGWWMIAVTVAMLPIHGALGSINYATLGGWKWNNSLCCPRPWLNQSKCESLEHFITGGFMRCWEPAAGVTGLHQPHSVLAEHETRRPALRRKNPRAIHMELFRGELNLITLLI